MTLRVSTGLRNAMLVEGSFRSVMQANDGCKIQIYEGTVPETADDPASGTLLLEITASGTGGGLHFEAGASGGVISKDDEQDWQGDVIVSGVPNYYRLVAEGDSAGSSTSQPRIQGEVGLAGADLNFSSLDFIEAATIKLDFYVVSVPTL